VQRLFSAFPGGRPGIGLLLLRITVGFVAIAQGSLSLANTSAPTVVTWATACLAIVSGTALLVGFLTPGTGLALALTVPLFWMPGRADGLIFDRIGGMLVIADAAAIAFLGPGAFSIDARLFGRREILVPHLPQPRS
jgi:uncharacterized membrane protein YphA (DoxX/SURF4 family)